MILKYKVYDVEAQKIRDVEHIEFNYHGAIEVHCCDETHLLVGEGSAILLQYTGRKDKNGSEIYDGHILKNKVTGKVFAVYWHEQCTGFTNLWNSNECLILGWIYLDPELIEG